MAEVRRLGRRPTLLLGALLLVVGGGAPDVDAEAEYAAAVAAPRTTRVVVVTLDGLGSRAVRHLPRRRTPTLHRLLREGTGTLEARTVREQTATLPNHVSIATGRRIRAAAGGHGVTWNDERLDPRTVQEAAGHAVASLFSVVGSPERHPALFTAKDKLALLDRSWPAGVARLVVRHDNRRLARATRRDLLRNRRPLTFLHLSLPDDAGHAHGFSSPAYFRAVTRVDRLLGTLVESIDSRRRLRRHVTLVVTADHGGRGAGHYDATAPADYRIPFVVWGVGVAPGTDLYDLNPDYRDPHRRRTTYRAERQPVRNADAANLATRLLGLGVVPGSEFGAASPLDVS